MSTAPAFVKGVTTGFGISQIIEILSGVKKAVIDEPSEAFLRLGKIEIAEKKFGMRELFASVFDTTNDAEPSLTIGISPNGMVDIFMTMIRATVWLSALIGDEMSEELLLEMLQEGVSNAIQTSIGGTFQTVYNIFRGSMPVYGDDLTNIPQIMEHLDKRILYYNVASAGMNIFATLHYLLYGAVNSLTQSYSSVYNQVQSFANRLIEEDLYLHVLQIEYARNHLLSDIQNSISAVDGLVRYGYEVIDTALAKINDMINQLLTVKSDLENDVIDPDRAYAIATGIYNAYNNLKNDVDNEVNNTKTAIQNITVTISEDSISNYKTALDDYRTVLIKMVNKVNDEYCRELSEMMDDILDLVDALLAYRFYTDYDRDLNNLPEETFFEKYVPSMYTLEVKVVGEE